MNQMGSLRSESRMTLESSEKSRLGMEENMKFCWITINVRDFEKSLEFYTKVAGLSVDRMMNPNPKMKIAFLGSGETKVELIYDDVNSSRNYGKDVSIGFEVDSIDAFVGILKEKGIELESGPHQPNPMIKFIYVLDPNGFRVQFIENIKRV
jgi:lactoylglutathione lyase